MLEVGDLTGMSKTAIVEEAVDLFCNEILQDLEANSNTSNKKD